MDGVVKKLMYVSTCVKATAIPLFASGSMLLGLPFKDNNDIHSEKVMQLQGLLCVF
jgi:hypothetical protein